MCCISFSCYRTKLILQIAPLEFILQHVKAASPCCNVVSAKTDSSLHTAARSNLPPKQTPLPWLNHNFWTCWSGPPLETLVIPFSVPLRKVQTKSCPSLTQTENKTGSWSWKACKTNPKFLRLRASHFGTLKHYAFRLRLICHCSEAFTHRSTTVVNCFNPPRCRFESVASVTSPAVLCQNRLFSSLLHAPVHDRHGAELRGWG